MKTTEKKQRRILMSNQQHVTMAIFITWDVLVQYARPFSDFRLCFIVHYLQYYVFYST